MDGRGWSLQTNPSWIASHQLYEMGTVPTENPEVWKPNPADRRKIIEKEHGGLRVILNDTVSQELFAANKWFCQE